MTIREAIKQQQKSVKNKSFQERFAFFWEYYALKTFVLLLAIVVVVAFVLSMILQKEYAFTGMFFGAEIQPTAEDYLDDFASSANIDLKDYTLTVQAGPDIRMDQQVSTEIYQSMETFSAMVAAQSVSCFAGNTDLFLYYAYLGYATDLRTVLSSQELKELDPYLYYIDAHLIRQYDESDGGYADAYWNRPSDPTKPERMADPVPVGIALEAASEDFQNSYHFTGTNLIGICESSEFPEYATAFFRYSLSLTP